MSLIPDWAPNVHPLVIHFPIALFVTAVLVDFVAAVAPRPGWLGAAGTGLYAAAAVGAIVACATGLQAAATVHVLGMAPPILENHRVWALATAFYAGIVALIRVFPPAAVVPLGRWPRVLLLVAGVLTLVLLQQTADLGGQLVYEYGVGVIPPPVSP